MKYRKQHRKPQAGVSVMSLALEDFSLSLALHCERFKISSIKVVINFQLGWNIVIENLAKQYVIYIVILRVLLIGPRGN